MTNNEEIKSENAQEMTEAIYNVHSAVNDVLMGGILNTESSEVAEEAETKVEAETEKNSEVVDVSMEAAESVNESVNVKHDESANDNEIVTFTTTTTTATPTTSLSSSSISPQLVREQLKYCQRILKGLKRHREAGPFLLPVDPVALGIPDYFDVIKQPMDLGTISKKCDLNEYGSAEAFMSDVRLTLTNCFTYNAPDSQVTKMGRSLEKYFNTSMSKMPTDLGTVSGTGISSVASSSSVESPASRPKRESVVAGVSGVVRRPSSSSSSMTFCSSVLRELMKKTNSHLNWPFMLPVDPIALGIPDYFDVVKQPMDLGTIRKKLDTGMYSRSEQFEGDVHLVFSNCYAYNPPESDVYRMAQQLEAIFEQKMNQKPSPKIVEKVNNTNTASSTSAGSSTSSLHGHGHHATGSSSFIPSSASQLIPGLDSLEDDSEKILAINHQIQILQAELNFLLLNRKSSNSSSVGSVGSKASAGAGNVKPKKKPATPSALNKALSVPASNVNVNAVSSVSDEMTFEEKRQLSEDVSSLPQENMMRVLEIIQECMPDLHSNGDSDVIELDIEALDVRTLRTLQNYIWECQNPGKKRKPHPASKVTKKSKDHQPETNANTTTTNNSAANYDSSSSSSSSEDDD